MNWICSYSSVPGRKHIRAAMPCQDASFSKTDPRPFLIVCDGRGSSPDSHHGAVEAISAVSEYLSASEPLFSMLLDSEDENLAKTLLGPIAKSIVAIAAGRQQLLADRLKLPVSAFEFTFIFGALGRMRSMFIHVGDGAIVAKIAGRMRLLSPPSNGEYANLTDFVRFGKDNSSRMRVKLMPSDGIEAIAAFTDGTAEKMLKANTFEPASEFLKLWQSLSEMRLDNLALCRFLTESFWEPSVQDDRSMALLCVSQEVGSSPNIDEASGAALTTKGANDGDEPISSQESRSFISRNLGSIVLALLLLLLLWAIICAK